MSFDYPLPEGWRWSSLDEIKASGRSVVSGPFGSNIGKRFFVESGVPVIRGNNLTTGMDRFSDAGFVYLTEDKAREFANCEAIADDLIFTAAGTIGQVGLIPKTSRYAKYIISNKQLRARLDTSKICPLFAFYWFSGPEMVRTIQSRNTGSTIPLINLSVLKSLPLPVPPLAEQRAIAEYLSTLDDRITLLRETNATLEAIAQAIFKSWFVDFDPVRAKQEGRAPEGMDEATAALFPDGFEESELGVVPRGWRVQTLGDVCSVTIGGLWGKDTKEEADLVPAISLRGVDLENLRTLGYAKDAPLRWVKQAAMEKRRVNECEVLIASSGAGPCGRPLWAGADFESIYGSPVIFSNFVKRLDCGTSAKAIYVDRLLADMRESKEIWNFINGTSIPNLDDKLLLATKKVVLPSDDVLLAFESIARSIYSKRYLEQAQTLVTLRDTLLPRLISGQLRLPEAEALAA